MQFAKNLLLAFVLLMVGITIGLIGSSCRAEGLPTVVGVHTVSYHLDTQKAEGDRGWNNVNPGIYARWDSGLTVGAYRNSLYKNSAYLGWTITDADDRFALTLGVVTGYDKVVNSGGRSEIRCEATCRRVQVKEVLLPMVVPSVRIGLTQHASLRVAALIAGRQTAAHLMLEYRL